jgi:hypothetical protein
MKKEFVVTEEPNSTILTVRMWRKFQFGITLETVFTQLGTRVEFLFV